MYEKPLFFRGRIIKFDFVIFILNFVAAALMKNTGVVVANDASSARLKAVIGNNHRLGTIYSGFVKLSRALSLELSLELSF